MNAQLDPRAPLEALQAGFARGLLKLPEPPRTSREPSRKQRRQRWYKAHPGATYREWEAFLRKERNSQYYKIWKATHPKPNAAAWEAAAQRRLSWLAAHPGSTYRDWRRHYRREWTRARRSGERACPVCGMSKAACAGLCRDDAANGR